MSFVPAGSISFGIRTERTFYRTYARPKPSSRFLLRWKDRLKLPMAEEELRTFLTDNKMLRLATIGADQGPRIVPLAFMYENGKFYVTTAVKSRKVRNITANSKVAFCVDVDRDPSQLKAVVGKGRAKILPSSNFRDEIRARLITHLVGSLEHPYAKVMMKPDRVIIEITPTSITSWENALIRQGVTGGS